MNSAILKSFLLTAISSLVGFLSNPIVAADVLAVLKSQAVSDLATKYPALGFVLIAVEGYLSSVVGKSQATTTIAS